MTEPISGEVMSATVEVDIPGITHGLVVGPDDVLVLRIPYVPEPAILQAHRDQIETVLGNDRYLIMCGDWELATVHRPRNGKPEIEGTRPEESR